jgi:ABC-type nitrate/sulfonate/bicarbonate transport system substrate-binding protein
MFGGGGDVIKAMASGGVQIGEAGSSPFTAAASQGQDLKLFWILDDIGDAEALIARTLSLRDEARALAAAPAGQLPAITPGPARRPPSGTAGRPAAATAWQSQARPLPVLLLVDAVSILILINFNQSEFSFSNDLFFFWLSRVQRSL